MKKLITYSLASLLFLSTTTSCSDFLDKEPDDMLTLEMVFNNKKKTEEWLGRVYTDVQDAWWNDFRNQGMLSDEIQVSLELVSFGYGVTIGQQQGSWDPTSGVNNYWESFYKAIRSGYIFLESAKALPEQDLPEKDVEFMRNEVRFLISYYYVYMMQLYGPVPLVTSKFDSNASANELMLPRTPMMEIAEWVDKELLELANYFPSELPNPSAQFGRPTKGVCLALRAHLWTFMASPIFNGNPYYADVKNPDGTALFPTEDKGLWEKAAKANLDVIKLAETGVYDLYKEYYKGKLDPFKSCQYLFLTSGDVNKEIIWARTDCNHAEVERLFNPRGIGAYGSCSVSQNLVDAFRMRDGKDITVSAEYKEDGFIDKDIIYPDTYWNLSDENKTEGLITPKGTFNMWANREPRFYTTIRRQGEWIPEYKRTTQYANGQQDGRPSHDTPACGYHGRKGTHPGTKPREGYYPYHPAIIFRLAEFYLNYAEALAQYDPSNADILKYVNLIRERGGIPALPTSLLGNSSELQKEIRKEFHVEFAMEGKSRYDYIRRWLLADDIFKTPITGMNQYGEDNQQVGDEKSFYTRTSVMKRVFQPKMYLWPINQNFVDKNPNLVQNKGWN